MVIIVFICAWHGEAARGAAARVAQSRGVVAERGVGACRDCQAPQLHKPP